MPAEMSCSAMHDEPNNPVVHLIMTIIIMSSYGFKVDFDYKYWKSQYNYCEEVVDYVDA